MEIVPEGRAPITFVLMNVCGAPSAGAGIAMTGLLPRMPRHWIWIGSPVIAPPFATVTMLSAALVSVHGGTGSTKKKSGGTGVVGTNAGFAAVHGLGANVPPGVVPSLMLK